VLAVQDHQAKTGATDSESERMALEVRAGAVKPGTVTRNEAEPRRVAGRTHAPTFLGRRDDKHLSFCSFLAYFELFLGHCYLLSVFKVLDSAQNASLGFSLAMNQEGARRVELSGRLLQWRNGTH